MVKTTINIFKIFHTQDKAAKHLNAMISFFNILLSSQDEDKFLFKYYRLFFFFWK